VNGRGTPATLDLRVGDDLGDAPSGRERPELTLYLRTKGLT
jgi:hypothetical protein